MPLPLILERGILLQPVREADAPAVFEETDRSRRVLREWLPWLDGVKTVEDTHRFIQLAQKKQRDKTGITFVIFQRETVVGVVDLHGIDTINRLACLGYWLGESYQGQGIMRTVVRGLTGFAFKEMNLNRLEIRVAPGNIRSRRVAEVVGFRYEGCLKEAEWLYTTFVDHDVFALLKREWAGQGA